MSNLRTLRFRTVVIQLPTSFAAGNEVTFPDQDDLRDAIIEGIETYSADDSSQTPEAQAVIASALDNRLTVVLADKSNDRVKYLPYRMARAVLMCGQVRQLNAWPITWPQCRIRCVQSLGNASGPVYAMVGVHFRYPSDR